MFLMSVLNKQNKRKKISPTRRHLAILLFHSFSFRHMRNFYGPIETGREKDRFYNARKDGKERGISEVELE